MNERMRRALEAEKKSAEDNNAKSRWPIALFALLLAVGAALVLLDRDEAPDIRLLKESYPRRIMGTSCRLLTVERRADRGIGKGQAPKALRAGESTLRAVEGKMSSWIGSSELSRFNAATASSEAPLSAGTRAVLASAKALHQASGGAFDITCRPLIQLWRKAGKAGKLPSDEELRAARQASRWEQIELTGKGAKKRLASARVDLGGIAKGYGIDRAAKAMEKAGVAGGMVDVGGDLRVFGLAPHGAHWLVAIRDPFGGSRREAKVLSTLKITAGAVCTSGNYARFVTIEGERFSHIVDPRSGRPANAVPSVTVVGPDAMRADAWATALSVLGEAGLARLPEGFEAMLILGTKAKPRAVASAGFAKLLTAPLPFPLTARR